MCEKPKYCGYLLIILTNASLSLPHSSEYRWFFSIIEIVFIHILIFYKLSLNVFVRISVILLCGSEKKKKNVQRGKLLLLRITRRMHHALKI